MFDLARQLDAQDPLASFRERFVVDDPNLVYLDGNSLGRLPLTTAERLSEVVQKEWGNRLIRSWNEGWYTMAQTLGDKIGRLIGAEAGQTILSDSTSVNLYKLAYAALRARENRTEVLTDDQNFPSDVYLLQGLADQLGRHLVIAPAKELEHRLCDQTALLSLSHVAFKSGQLLNMRNLTQGAHEVGALVLWDLSHSVGALPVTLDADGADLAVGCCYKYLNGGPGAPAFLYVRKELQDQLRQPIQGWFGQARPFGFELDYEPAPGLAKFLVGTPPLISLAAIGGGVDLALEAGTDALRAKSLALTAFFIELSEQHLTPHGLSVLTPKEPHLRGSHVTLAHPQAWGISQALIRLGVIPDFRAPDGLRFGFAPLYNTFAEAARAVEATTKVMVAGDYHKVAETAPTVT